MQPYFDPTRKMISKKNGRRPKKMKKMEDDLKKMDDKPINLIGCDTIVNSPSLKLK